MTETMSVAVAIDLYYGDDAAVLYQRALDQYGFVRDEDGRFFDVRIACAKLLTLHRISGLPDALIEQAYEEHCYLWETSFGAEADLDLQRRRIRDEIMKIYELTDQLTSVDIAGQWILFTGGLTPGDPPTDVHHAVMLLDELELFNEAITLDEWWAAIERRPRPAPVPK